MKKIYVKPCSVCMSMAVENAMLAGSGVTVSDGGFTPQPGQTWSNARENSFQNEDEDINNNH